MPGDSHVMIQIHCIGFMGILVPHHIGFCFIKFLPGFQDLDGQSSSPSPIFFPKDLHDWAVLTTRIDGIYHLPQKLLEAGGPLPELGTASRREGSEFLFLSMSHMLQNCVICPLSCSMSSFYIIFGRYRAVIGVENRFHGSLRIVAKTLHNVCSWSFLIWNRSIQTPLRFPRSKPLAATFPADP